MDRRSDADGPIRTCIGCRVRRPQHELVRCVLAADGIGRVDRVGAGRGAWLCGVECFEAAVKRRAFERAWRTSVRPEQLVRIGQELRVASADSGARLNKTKG